MIENVLLNYDIGNLIEVTNIESGTTSKAKYIKTSMGEYVLRELKDEKQGSLEWLISDANRGDTICPEIILNKIGSCVTNYKNNFYNLQRYVNTEKWVIDDLKLFKIGSAISRFHFNVSSINLEEENFNRFDLRALWKKLKKKQYFNELKFALPLFTSEIEEHLILEEYNTDLIHGDLGIWNIIYDGNNFNIIDFGEVRKGSRYFDLAGVICSLISKTMSDSEMKKHIEAIVEGYNENEKISDYGLLSKMIHLWMLRGLVSESLLIISLEKSLPKIIKNIELKERIIETIKHFG